MGDVVRRLLLVLPLALMLAPSASAGAWEATYHEGLTGNAGTLRAYSIIAVKRELAYNGFTRNLDLTTPYFGSFARNRTIDFQRAHSLTASGTVGPTTARYLFRQRAYAVEVAHGIPDHLLAKMKTLESANDPAALGPSGKDTGLYQIHLGFHPDVTLAEAVYHSFSAPWSGDRLRETRDSLGDWDGAVAAHNVGTFYARAWVDAGKPPAGKVLASGVDIFAVATRYVALVRASAT